MNIIVRESVLDRSFLTGTSDFGKVERASATTSGVEDPVIQATELSPFKSWLRGTRLQKRDRSAVAKFGVDFNKDVYSE